MVGVGRSGAQIWQGSQVVSYHGAQVEEQAHAQERQGEGLSLLPDDPPRS